MKDLKAYIQKNNMKKLVISAVLSMFCYCTNNAAEIPQPVKVKDINFVLNFMIKGQIMILNAKFKIMLAQRKKIYSTIKDQEKGKVKKNKLLNFIKNQISTKDKTDEELKDDIKKIEQYFHLEEIKEDNGECNEGNLTEIFWEKGEEGDLGEEKIEDVVDEIKSYFITIILIEKTISKVFKEYYDAKKAKKEKVENVEDVEDVVIKEIMQECCGKETDGDIPTKFFANLGNLCPKKLLEEHKKTIIATIKKRITLTEQIKEADIKSFLKQKIGEDKKEVEQKIGEEGCCPCCDCWEKKKNPEVVVINV